MQHGLQFSGIKKGAKISFHRHFNDGANPTAGIDKDYHNRFTAILNFPKIEVVLNLFNRCCCFFFFTLAENVKQDVLIRIRLKKVTRVILELQTHKSKIKGV